MLSVLERQSFTAVRRLGSGGTRISGHTNSISQRTISTTTAQKSLLQQSAQLRTLNCNYHRIRTMVMITQTKATSNPDDFLAANESTDSKIDPQSQQQLQSYQQHDDGLSVVVTDACYQRIHYLISQKKKKNAQNSEVDDKDSNSYYLRVFVDAGGCSGFTYQFELDTDTNLNATDDVIFTESISTTTTATTATTMAARVVIDRGSLKLLAGSKIDYVQEMIKSTFEVRDNPQSESACGCGSSFAVKNFTSNPAID